MKEISQEEFEAGIQDVIDGKTTRTELMEKTWHMGADKLNTRIQELAVYNPELYRAFDIKFPYRPREYTHIDYEAVIIDILKNGYKRRDWDDIYEVDSRTITRKIHDIFENNGLKTQILAASFKNSLQVLELCEYGVGASTVAPDIIEGFINNPNISSAVDVFTKDFEGLCGEGKTMLDCE